MRSTEHTVSNEERKYVSTALCLATKKLCVAYDALGIPADASYNTTAVLYHQLREGAYIHTVACAARSSLESSFQVSGFRFQV